MESEAGERAIADAGLSDNDIELIVVARSTPDRKAPSTAAIVQHKFRAKNAAALDINAVCSGFLFAMSIASQYIASGVYNNILVIGANTFPKITNWTRRDAFFLRWSWCSGC